MRGPAEIDDIIHNLHSRGIAHGNLTRENLNQGDFIHWDHSYKILDHDWAVEHWMRERDWTGSYEEFVNDDYFRWRDPRDPPPRYFDKVPGTEEWYDVRFGPDYELYISGECGSFAKALKTAIGGTIVGVEFDDFIDHYMLRTMYKGNLKYVDATGVYRNIDSIYKVWEKISQDKDIEYETIKIVDVDPITLNNPDYVCVPVPDVLDLVERMFE